jgi:hypothetical protein
MMRVLPAAAGGGGATVAPRAVASGAEGARVSDVAAVGTRLPGVAREVPTQD